MKPIGYYASVRSDHPDANILDRIAERFGGQLEELTDDDKTAVAICLLEKATDTQQVFIQENFFTNSNGGELWQMGQHLTEESQLKLALAILNQII
jgi:hypothetical protein